MGPIGRIKNKNHIGVFSNHASSKKTSLTHARRQASYPLEAGHAESVGLSAVRNLAPSASCLPAVRVL